MINIKNNENYKHYLLAVFIPLVGITVLFTYAFIYVQNEISFISHEKKGLNKIYKVQDIIFDIQKLRGLSNIQDKDQNRILDIKTINKNVKTKVIKFQEQIKHIKKGTHLKEEFEDFFKQIIHHLADNNDFNHISKTIHNARLFIENISYHSNLALDSQLKSHILSQTIVMTLPELIEYNGQIRGISSAIKNHKLTIKQKNEIILLQSKIQDKIKQLQFSIEVLDEKWDLDIIKTIYLNTISAQNSLLNFVTKEILLKDKIMLNSANIFKLESNNIEFITILYKENFKELNQLLTKRIKNKKIISIMIVISAIASIIFILFINLNFYQRNQNYINNIKTLSITDGMTKLFNRRHFDNEFLKQLKIQKRAKQNLIFIIMDIDHFKQYNDIYGHQEGDSTLINVATCLKSDLNRPNDMAFRLGGEEFGVLCSDMDKDQAFNFANKLRINIQNLNIKHNGNSASEFVTISMGLIVIPPDINYKVDDAYKYADEALYNAKQNGRNSVSIYTI